MPDESSTTRASLLTVSLDDGVDMKKKVELDTQWPYNCITLEIFQEKVKNKTKNKNSYCPHHHLFYQAP